MLKSLTFRIIRSRVRWTLPLLNNKIYNKMFNLTYSFFLNLKASEILVIILSLLNKTDLKSLLNIPSIFILFNSIFADSDIILPNVKGMYSKLEANKLTNEGNKLDTFFWVVITMALIQRALNSFFRLLWIPFKLAFYFWVLKHLGFDLSFIYNVLSTLSLGIIDWFYNKITNFEDFINNKNDNNN